MENDWIKSKIKTGKYNKEKSGDFTINKCNLFVDDVAQKGWGVKLPRYKHSPVKHYEGWDERPLEARQMRYFLNGLTAFGPSSGVKRLDRKSAWQAANSGGLVVVTNGTHSTVMAPSKSRPKVYRSDQEDRRETRYRVGVSENYDFFYVDPTEYSTFMGAVQRTGERVEDIIVYGSTITDQMDRYRNEYLDDKINLRRAAKRERR
jgi:hypothetical protein